VGHADIFDKECTMHINIWCGCGVVALAIALTTGTCWGSSTRDQDLSDSRKTSAEADYQRAEGDIVKQLNDKALWVDPDRKDMLLGLIRTAGTLRLPAAVPSLAQNISFSLPAGQNKLHMQPISLQFPASGALVQIGLPAVPALIEVAKADPKSDQDVGRKITIALRTLIDIYAQGFDGRMADKRVMAKSMARYRIQMAMQGAELVVADRLKACLDGPVLAPGSDADMAAPLPDDAPPPPIAPKRLTGSGIGFGQSIRQSDIVLAAVTLRVKAGPANAQFIGEVNAEIEPTRILKGSLKEKRVSIKFPVNYIPNQEVPPKEGGSYIYFLSGNKPENLNVIKIVEDNSVNLNAIGRESGDRQNGKDSPASPANSK
jgi:hypothetical protein